MKRASRKQDEDEFDEQDKEGQINRVRREIRPCQPQTLTDRVGASTRTRLEVYRKVKAKNPARFPPQRSVGDDLVS